MAKAKVERVLQGIIGLEIHVYLTTKEKLFCRCRAVREKGTEPNKFICPICTGQPGAKPTLPNKTAVEKAVQIGLMLGCKINERIFWQRKHYSWPDLPKGFQSTLSGPRAFPVGERGKFFGIKIRGIHLEEDPAAWEPATGGVDYNRSGLPLVEIVTEPDFSTAEEVKEWLGKLIHNLVYLKAIQKDAGLKVDVNVSLRGGERVEIKNVNSIENICLAIEHELERQAREKSERETRRFDSEKGVTVKMRSKEEAQDYRFISDPDLAGLVLDKNFVSALAKKLPETPEKKLEKLIGKYKIGKEDAAVLSKHLEVVEFFERVAEKVEPRFALHWVTVELLRHLNYHSKTLNEVEIAPEHFVELLNAVRDGKITELQAKNILNAFYPKSFSLRTRGVEGKISSSDELTRICQEVLAREKDVVMRYRAGEKKLINFLVGEVMRRTEKRADFKIVLKVLENLLK